MASWNAEGQPRNDADERLISRPRRVLYVINSLTRAGAETQLVELAVALDKTAWEPAIVLIKKKNDFEERLREANIRVIALDRRGFWDIGLPFRLMRVIKRMRPDVVHSFLFLANFWSVVVGRMARVSAFFIVSQRCSYEATLTPFWRFIARRSHRLANRVVVNSRAAFAEERRAGLADDHLVYVPNGIRLDTAIAAPSLAQRAALNLPRGRLVLAVGQLAAVKGHRTLIDAWPAVAASIPDAKLVLVGDGQERPALERQARAAGVEAFFLGVRVPAWPYFAACDILVQPSLTEGMPNAVLEAMAMARPVVASSVGGNAELVVDQETGLLVPPADPRALADAIKKVLSDKRAAERMGERGRARARDCFSMTIVRDIVCAIYREAAAAA